MSLYTPELAEEVVQLLAEGRSMRQIAEMEGMPSRRTLLYWLEKNQDFCTKCTHARELGADVLLDAMADIEDRTLDGSLDPQAARVVLSSQQWRASKLSPKKYGDKQAIEHSGEMALLGLSARMRKRGPLA